MTANTPDVGTDEGRVHTPSSKDDASPIAETEKGSGREKQPRKAAAKSPPANGQPAPLVTRPAPPVTRPAPVIPLTTHVNPSPPQPKGRKSPRKRPLDADDVTPPGEGEVPLTTGVDPSPPPPKGKKSPQKRALEVDDVPPPGDGTSKRPRRQVSKPIRRDAVVSYATRSKRP
ncbi:hypothetical protein BDN72DRAFT_907467 [Pluteus cervinus]|uniref:Uncharacterized protein n=1 Tax=Pluteus cervinus TaxID=181527 RepID=A0ACD2ZXC9_9AGAR|nr:hypothetical protein BDN72DRAFT_907467 [Pluteus cervinus]